MQLILNTYTKLFQVTGRAVNLQKTNYFTQQQKRRNGKLSIQNVDIELTISDIKLNQLNYNQAIEMLGVYISPTIIWDWQFEVIADKMRIVTAKLHHIKIHHQQAYLFYNAYFTKSIYFGAEIMQLNKE